MAWLAADIDGTVYKYKKKPVMCTDCWMPDDKDNGDPVKLKMSEVTKITGKRVTWDDSPIQIK
jgi:hypothetical protein